MSAAALPADSSSVPAPASPVLPWARCSGEAAPAVPAADSIADSAADTAAFTASPAFPSDTLPRWRGADPAAVYGTLSARAEPPAFRAGARGSLVATASFECAVLLLAGLYVMLLYRNLGDVRSLVGRISRDAASSERLAEDPGRSGFVRFLRIATAIGLLFSGLALVKGADELCPPAVSSGLSQGLSLALPLLCTGLCALLSLYRSAALRLAAAVTRTQPFVAQLLLVGRIYLALAVVVVTPALVLYALCPRGEGNLWLTLVGGGVIVTLLLYLRETLHLFLGKKISILHWFLYLCAVEIFPVSFVLLLLAR